MAVLRGILLAACAAGDPRSSPDQSDSLSLLHSDTGSVIRRYQATDELWSYPALPADRTLLVGDDDGVLDVIR